MADNLKWMNLPISEWDISKIVNITNVFANCKSPSLDDKDGHLIEKIEDKKQSIIGKIRNIMGRWFG